MDQDVYWAEKGDAPPVARFIRTGGVVWSKPHVCSCPAHKYHDIFSLEAGELGCNSLVKHEIRVVYDEPFKERF